MRRQCQRTTLDGVEMPLANTCPVHNRMWIFHNIYEHRSDVWMKERSENLKVHKSFKVQTGWVASRFIVQGANGMSGKLVCLWYVFKRNAMCLAPRQTFWQKYPSTIQSTGSANDCPKHLRTFTSEGILITFLWSTRLLIKTFYSKRSRMARLMHAKYFGKENLHYHRIISPSGKGGEFLFW